MRDSVSTQRHYLPTDLRNRRNLARGGYSSRPVPDLRGQARLRPPFTSFCTAGGDELARPEVSTMIPQSFRSRALWGAPSTSACGVGDYPTPDLSKRESGSRSASEKSKQFGPDGAPFPSKTSITRGPPVVAVAVSLDPILPHR